MNEREKITYLKENGYHRYPLVMQLEITRDCPFNCPQCYKVELEQKHMEFELLKRMVKEGIEKGVRVFALNGGEPLIYPQFTDVLKLFKNRTDIGINCFSSGFGLTDEIINIIKETPGLSFFISLNGSTKEINDLSRDGYDISIRVIRMLQEHQCPFGINWVARKDNLDDFENMVCFARENGVKQLSVTSNKLAENKTRVMGALNHQDLVRLAQIIKDNEDVYITVESCFPQLTAEMRKLRSSDGCAAGYFNVNVSLEGYFLPCTHLYYPERFDSIEEYWTQSKILADLRKNVFCKNCDKHCRFCKAMSPNAYRDFADGIHECARE